jgi:hypothetical protein
MRPGHVTILNIFIEVEALTSEVLIHLWEQMEVRRCQIRTVWWMWKNFPAPGVQEIHGCGSTVRPSTVVQKKKSESFGQQSWYLAPNSLLESLQSFLIKQLYLLLNREV